jgi:hypothetical protein
MSARPPTPAEERHYAILAKVESGLAAAEGRVTEQLLRIGALQQAGHDVAAATALMDELRAVLAEWQGLHEKAIRAVSPG